MKPFCKKISFTRVLADRSCSPSLVIPRGPFWAKKIQCWEPNMSPLWMILTVSENQKLHSTDDERTRGVITGYEPLKKPSMSSSTCNKAVRSPGPARITSHVQWHLPSLITKSQQPKPVRRHTAYKIELQLLDICCPRNCWSLFYFYHWVQIEGGQWELV